MKRIRSVLFDMDGVIVDSMRHHADAWIEVLRQYGLDVRYLDIYRREGMSGRDSIIDIFREKSAAYPGDAEMSIMIGKKLAIFDRRTIDLFPFVDELLLFLHERNVALALVTGSLRRSVDRILPSGIMELFRAIVTADDVTNGKPHPEPYETAMGLIGADAGSSVVIENAPQGIRSAVSAGIECYALETTLPGDYLSEAVKIFKNHLSLLDYFRENLK